MTKQQTIRQWITLILFFALLGAVLLRVYGVLKWKDTTGPYQLTTEGLYHTENNRIDVAFFGASHAYGAVNPDVLWQNHGIASFSFSTSGQDKQSTLHYIEELCKTQSPQVVVVDIYACVFDRMGEQGNVYRSLLSLDLSPNAADLVIKNVENRAERADYLLRWPIVHTRYRELKPEDFTGVEQNNYTRGYIANYACTPMGEEGAAYDEKNVTPLSETNRAFFEELFRLREKHGFRLELVLLPYYVAVAEQRTYNGIYEYLDSIGEEYTDFNRLRGEIGLSSVTDYADGGHLNVYGAEKVSAWFGAYLSGKYTLADHRGDAAYAQWEESVRYNAHVLLRETLPRVEGAVAYAGVLSGNEELTVFMTLSREAAQHNRTIRRMLELYGAPARFMEEGGVLVTEDGAEYHGRGLTLPDRILYDSDETKTFCTEKVDEAQNHYRILCNGETALEAIDGLAVLVYDRRLSQVIDTRYFDDTQETR